MPGPVRVPGIAGTSPQWYRPVDLIAVQRAQIAQETLLTRIEAAYLGISPTAFDRFRAAHGLRRADQRPGANGWPAYLYRLADVLRASRGSDEHGQ